jgi:hypothetical protein
VLVDPKTGQIFCVEIGNNSGLPTSPRDNSGLDLVGWPRNPLQIGPLVLERHAQVQGPSEVAMDLVGLVSCPDPSVHRDQVGGFGSCH